MLTTQFKVTIAVIAALSAVGALTYNQISLDKKIANLERQPVRTIEVPVTVVQSPTATPASSMKFIPTAAAVVTKIPVINK